MKLALKMNDLPGLLVSLSEKHDTSGLAKLFLMTAIREPKVNVEELKPCLESFVKNHLKTTFILL